MFMLENIYTIEVGEERVRKSCPHCRGPIIDTTGYTVYLLIHYPDPALPDKKLHLQADIQMKCGTCGHMEHVPRVFSSPWMAGECVDTARHSLSERNRLPKGYKFK